MDDVSTSAPEQVSVTQCSEATQGAGPIDRMKPIMGTLEWIPIGSGRHPDPQDHLAYSNPCDGLSFGYWDEEEGFMEGHPFTRTFANGRPGHEDAVPIGKECGGNTHYAVLSGPADPTNDISHNWKLYNAGYKTPGELIDEALERIGAAAGLDPVECMKAFFENGRDEQRALAALQAGGGQ